MAFVFSPSSLMTYGDCPRKFQAQSITKELKWKPRKEKSRGSTVHECLRKALRFGLQAVSAWPSGMDPYYTHDKITAIRSGMTQGYHIETEKELVVNHDLKPTGWWDDDAMLRAKADLVVFPPSGLVPLVVDYKTGKKWDDEDFQLRVEALLVHLVYGYPVVTYEYWYVDAGDTVDATIDFRNGYAPVEDIMKRMKDMNQAMKDNNFPPKRNKFCKWCDLYETPRCGYSK